MSWDVPFKRVLCQSKESLLESLLNFLSNVFICRGKVDAHV